MRLGWGRDDGPFFFSCPGRKPHERCEPGPILLCMGLFSRFCVWAPRCTAEEALRCGKVGTGFPSRQTRNAFARRSCSNKKIERDDDSKKSHPALSAVLFRIGVAIEAKLIDEVGGGAKSDLPALQGVQRLRADAEFCAGQKIRHFLADVV